jgi:hypothetical protein
MTITLRQRQKKKGKISLYLEIYKGREVDTDGKIKYLRHFEYLNLYLIDKPKTEADKHRNKEILNLANSIKSKKELEYQSGRFGLQTTNYKDTNFLEYYHHSIGNNKKYCLQSIIDYVGTGKKIKFSDITKSWCKKYLEFLHTKKNQNKSDELLNISTIVKY